MDSTSYPKVKSIQFDSELSNAIKQGDVAKVEQFISRLKESNDLESLKKPNTLNQTYLFIAAVHKQPIIAALLAPYFDAEGLNHRSEEDMYFHTYRETAFMAALRKGYADVVSVLLTRYVSLNLIDSLKSKKNEETILQLAAQHGNAEVVSVLLTYPVFAESLNAVHHWSIFGFHRTALIYAAEKGFASVVSVLMSCPKVLDYNQTNEAGNTALMMAVIENNFDVVQVMLPFLTLNDLYLKNSINNKTVFEMAEKLPDKNIKFALDFRKNELLGLVTTSINPPPEREEATEAELFIDFVPSERTIDIDLLIEARNGELEKVKTLMLQKANINIRNSNGQTPLMLAAEFGCYSVVEYLINYIRLNSNLADALKTRNTLGETALMLAAKNGLSNIINCLSPHLSLSDINARDHKGLTALMHASFNPFTNTAQILIAHLLKLGQANSLNLTDNKGRTALTIAIENNHVGVASVLIPHAIKANNLETHGNPAFILAAQQGCSAILSILICRFKLLRKSDLFNSTSLGHNALIAAAGKGHSAVVYILMPLLSKNTLGIASYTAMVNYQIAVAGILASGLQIPETLSTSFADMNLQLEAPAPVLAFSPKIEPDVTENGNHRKSLTSLTRRRGRRYNRLDS